MEILNNELRSFIGEHYDGSFWKPISDFYNRGVEAFQIFKFEEMVEFENKNYWVVIFEKWNYDPEDTECINDTDTLFIKAVEV